jgi:hypothetical protein
MWRGKRVARPGVARHAQGKGFYKGFTRGLAGAWLGKAGPGMRKARRNHEGQDQY